MKRIQLKTLCGCTREITWTSYFPYKIEMPLMRKLPNPFEIPEDIPFSPPELRVRTFVLSSNKPEKGIDAVYIEEQS